MKTFSHEIDTHLVSSGNIEDVLRYLTKKKDSIRKKHPEATEIRLHIEAESKWYEYDDSATPVLEMCLRVTRPETAEETFQRTAKQRKTKEAQRARDLAQLEALKEKLGQ